MRARALVLALIVCLLAVAMLTGCASKGAFVGSKLSMIFHKPSCPWAEQIRDKNRVWFQTRDEAIKAGYQPDSYCKP